MDVVQLLNQSADIFPMQCWWQLKIVKMAKIKSDEMKAHLLKIISAEIEQRFNCKVVDISLCSIIGNRQNVNRGVGVI